MVRKQLRSYVTLGNKVSEEVGNQSCISEEVRQAELNEPKFTKKHNKTPKHDKSTFDEKIKARIKKISDANNLSNDQLKRRNKSPQDEINLKTSKATSTPKTPNLRTFGQADDKNLSV